MNWLIALQLIPLIINLVKTAEGLLGPGTGTQKKAFVVDGITQVINAMVEFSTGGQKKTWEAINTFIVPIKALIDVIAGLFFPHEEE
jgi:hypothetical protein